MKIENYNWTHKTLVCNRVSYDTSDFVSMCIAQGTSSSLAEHLDCARTTVNSCIKKYFPELQKGNANIRTKFLNLIDMKFCTSCGETHSKQEFFKNSSRPDGLDSSCKNCIKIRDSKRARDYKKEYQDNKGYQIAKAAKRHAAKLRRTPCWSESEAILEFYKNCPEGYHVDHIIPLQGKTVSGLHVLENLQYLTAKENLSKSNSYEP